jgi:hypothetical protein
MSYKNIIIITPITRFIGSEGFEKPRGQQAHLPSQDFVIQDLPKETVNGKILGIDDKKDPCEIRIWTNRGMVIQKITHDYLTRFVTGYTNPETAKGKNISLITQGHSKGVPHVRSGTIS